MKCTHFFVLIFLAFSFFLKSAEEVQSKEASPNVEIERLLAYGKKGAVVLSDALKELIVDVCDKEYEGDFFSKLKEAEKKQFDGEYVDYWESGKLKIKAPLKKGIPDGHVHGWFENGQESFKAYFDQGVKTGVHIAFACSYGKSTESWERRVLTFNLKGDLDGEQSMCYQNSRLKAIVHFKNGLLHGEMGTFKDEGGAIKLVYYKKGKRTKSPRKPGRV